MRGEKMKQMNLTKFIDISERAEEDDIEMLEDLDILYVEDFTDDLRYK
ncbi:hypothetical protein HYX08_01840 [Candidatus Woesearchaeota archaeon]|nr:hypothetical protein [Candidatus Woesearchaeota archaeon]